MKQIYPPFDDSLLLQYLLGKAGEEERRKIEGWLHEAPEHCEYLDSLEKIWVETGRITPAPVAVDVSAAWNRISHRIDREGAGSNKAPGGARILRIPALRYVAAAAAVVVLSAGLWLVARLVLAPAKPFVVSSTTTVVRDTLSDGTVVSMNRNTTLTCPEKFRNDRREVNLNGEAFFEVMHDARQPFIVKAGRAEVMVLGTSFNIRAYQDRDVEVNVATGTVLLFTVDRQSGDTSSVVLAAGKKGILRVSASRPELAEAPLPDELYWYDHTLEFRQTPLSEVFSLLEKYYSVRVRANDPGILKCRLTASFSQEPIGRVLEVISGSFNLTVKQEGVIYVFYGNGCY